MRCEWLKAGRVPHYISYKIVSKTTKLAVFLVGLCALGHCLDHSFTHTHTHPSPRAHASLNWLGQKGGCGNAEVRGLVQFQDWSVSSSRTVFSPPGSTGFPALGPGAFIYLFVLIS